MKRLLFILLFILGCSSTPVLDSQVQDLIDDFYLNFQNKNHENNLKHFSQDYFKITPPEKTLRMFENLEENTGDLLTYTFINYKVTKINDNRRNGILYGLHYQSTWTQGTTEDYFFLFKEDGKYKIDGFHSQIGKQIIIT